MRKKMFAALGIILMLFAFVACQGEPTTISEEQAKANELAADYISSIRYAEVLNVAFKNNSDLKVEATDATSVTVTFNNYTGDAVPATGDIKGIKSGSLKYTFTTPKAPTDKDYTIETVDSLVFILKDGSTAEDTIEFKISGSCEIDLTTDSSNKITGVKDAEFGETETAEKITVGDMPVNGDDIEITIDNSTPSTEPSEPVEPNLYSLTENKNYSDIKEVLKNYDGIKGKSGVVLTVDETIKLDKSFTFEDISLKGGQTEQNADESPIGIDLSDSTGDITLTIKNSKLQDFGYAICSNKANGKGENGTVNNGSLTLVIENTDFSNCYKGLYATDIKNLTVEGGTYDGMGKAATTENDVVKRSGAAFDINQMYAGGGNITFTGVTFKNCGGSDTTSKTTSGAIKVKVRGGEDDAATDIPAITNAGKITSLTVKDCTFEGNRADVVIGTSGYHSTSNFDYSIQSDCLVENNSLKFYTVTTNANYSTLNIELDKYEGIRGNGKGDDCVVLTVDEPIELTKDFTFENIILKGSQATQQPSAEPTGIDLSSSTEDITLTIKNSKLQDFGYAICSNKANGSGENGTVNKGSLTLVIENSDFSNCYKGLYATDIKNLTVTGGTYDKMGTAATEEPNDVVKRSGAAFDINQMYSEGENITFTNVTFSDCGGTDNTAKTTSGAIKVKVRGGNDDVATDIPKITTPGAIKSLTVKNCTFEGNRADVVLGTSEYKSTGNFKVNDDIQTVNDPANSIKIEERYKDSTANQ